VCVCASEVCVSVRDCVCVNVCAKKEFECSIMVD